jgi:PAS domain S-box-containing protein
VDEPRLGAAIGDALAHINAPAYVLDSKGTIRWLNPKAIELVGDHRGEHFTVTVAPETRRRSREAFAEKVVGGARTTDYETVLLLRSGGRATVELHTVALTDGGRIVGVFGIVDVGEQPARTYPTELTPRQYEILRALARGASTAQMAESMRISRETVRNHVRALLTALGVNSRLEALVEGRRRGLID